MKFRCIVSMAALWLCQTASAGLMTAPSVGDTVSIKMTGFAKGSANVDVTLDSHGLIGAGQLLGQLNGQSFLTYCVDLGQSFKWNTNYSYTVQDNNPALGSAPLLGSGFSQQQANLLGRLYTAYGSAAAASTTNDSVAFQLAVWEILYETGSVGSITGGAFNLVSGASTAQRNLTNDWLTDITRNNAPQSFTALRLYSPVAQDFVMFTPLPPRPQLRISVPEPTTHALVGIALAGLGLARRRRR